MSTTSGPWTVLFENCGNGANIGVIHDGLPITLAWTGAVRSPAVLRSHKAIENAEAVANAHLMAAALEMLPAGKHLAIKLAEAYRAAGVDPAKCQAIHEWMAVAAKADPSPSTPDTGDENG